MLWLGFLNRVLLGNLRFGGKTEGVQKMEGKKTCVDRFKTFKILMKDE